MADEQATIDLKETESSNGKLDTNANLNIPLSPDADIDFDINSNGEKTVELTIKI